MRKTALVLALLCAAVLGVVPATAQLYFDPNNWGAPPRPPMDIGPPQQQRASAPATQYVLPAHLRQQERAGLAIKGLAVGDIFIDRKNTYLYLITGPDSAIRYGVSVGREGFGEITVGKYYICDKRVDPPWRPTRRMLREDPKVWRLPLEPGRNLPWAPSGAPYNPFGPRAMSLCNAEDQMAGRPEGKQGRDSELRIHGTNEPWTIGDAKSSGCFRMENKSVIDLFDRVEKGTRVVVR